MFEYPKSVDLVKLLVQSVGDKDGLVVDFFSGSATTAHAVLKANAEDQGNRRFILIQKPEKVKPGSVAEKEGYSTIDEMGRERILRAAEELRTIADGLVGTGFRHYTLEADTKRGNGTDRKSVV